MTAGEGVTTVVSGTTFSWLAKLAMSPQSPTKSWLVLLA